MGRKKLRRVGIDVSARELHVAVEDADEVGTFENSADGHKTLLKSLTKRGFHADVVVESTAACHLDLALALAQHKRCRVMVANPRLTKHFHLGSGIRAKTDAVDCQSLLAYAVRMEFVEWTPLSERVLELRATTRYADQLVKEQTRLKNQLHAATSHSTAPAWMIEDLQHRLAETAQRIERVREMAVKMVQQNPELAPHLDRLTSMTGIGKATATRLLADFEALDPEMTSKQIAAWAGLDPRPRRSGTSLNGRPSISKHGSARARAALNMPALTASRTDGPPKDFYERVLASSGQKMVALTALMRKMLVISWALYRTESSWDASKAAPRPAVGEAA